MLSVAPEEVRDASHPAIQGAPALEEPSQLEDLGRQLVNSGLYDWALEDLPEFGLKRVKNKHAPRLALLLHNQLQRGTRASEASRLNVNSFVREDIQTTDLQLPVKWSLPIIRRIYPAIFDAPFFATQPMPGPLAYAFFIDFLREADGSDFRYVAPFTAQVGTASIVGATSVILSISGKPNAIGFGPYQIFVGQSITLSIGTGNAETKVISAFNRATGAITITAAGFAHSVGDFCYIAAPAALGEAAVPPKGKLSLTRQQVTAQKWMLAATWSTEAMEDARAQLNLDVEAEMVQALSVEIGREIFGTIISDIFQGATGGSTTLPLIGALTHTDYRLAAIKPVYDAEAKIFSRRFHDVDTLLCGVDLAANIAQQDAFHITPADPNNTLAGLGVTYLGVYQGKFNLYKTIFLPPNAGIMFNQPKDWLHAGYVYMPYVPLSPMPLVYAGFQTSGGNYQNTDEWTRNIRTRAGRLLTISDEYGLIIQA